MADAAGVAYADEIVPRQSVEELADVDGVDVSPREVKMAELLVESLTGPFDPNKYTDDYRVQVSRPRKAGEERRTAYLWSVDPSTGVMCSAEAASGRISG